MPEIIEVNGHPASGAHVYLDRSTALGGDLVLMLDAMQEGAITEVTSVRFRTRWSTKIN